MNTKIRQILGITFLTISSLPLLNARSVSVDFNNASRYTDIREEPTSTEKDVEHTLNAIRDSFQRYAKKYLAEEYTLNISVTDVDLAGDTLLPEAYGHDFRILKEIYPPRIDFKYNIVDDNGELVHESKSTLKDRNYLGRPNFLNADSAPYISELIKEWSRRELNPRI